MIKYPVRISSLTSDGDGNDGYTLEDSDGYVLGFIYEDKSVGDTIVNALNAMNEFPVERTQIALRFLRKYSTSVYNWVYKWFSTEGE